MRHPDPIDSFHRAAQRHAFDDGIAEILIGVLLAAGAFFVPRRGIVVLAVAALLAWFLPRLRDRITTPRAGWAALASPPPGRTLAGMALYGVASGAVALLAAWIASAFGMPSGRYRWLPLFVGLFVSGGFLHVASSAGCKRFYVYFAASTLGGLAFFLTLPSPSRQDAYLATTHFLWALAALLLIGGAITLILFLRRNPLFTAGPEGGHPVER